MSPRRAVGAGAARMVLNPRIPAPDWRKGKCWETVLANDSYDPFFEDMSEALDFCNGDSDGKVCPIRQECMVFALTNNQKEGVWGGTSELTRRALRKRWPLKGREPRPEWEWMTEDEAIHGINLLELFTDEEDEDCGY